MLTHALVVARKELVDHCRDSRSIVSALLYSLMGPAVLLLIMLARGAGASAAQEGQPWHVMAAVFALMAAFTGAMGPAMDMIAGERERRTLLPLVLSSPSRRAVIVGKWIAASAFAAAGLATNLLGFVVVFALASKPAALVPWLLAAPALVSLALLAAALETLVATCCRSTKEANTYLSLLVFITMGVAMWLAFRPDAGEAWLRVTPLAGHQDVLTLAFGGISPPAVQVVLVAVQSSLLAAATAASTLLVLAAAWTFFEREEMIYGG
jgi:sodium transport system permease protein